MLLFFVLPALATAVALVCFGQTAQAVQTVPYKMNFQGRLTDAGGTPKPDGIYNIKFRIYNATNTAVWTEDRLVSAAQGVQVSGGLFTVQLGSITPLDPAFFNTATTNQNGMTLEVELPTPATATSSSPSWTEGAMTPRSPLAASAYAFNSDTLDGLDSTDLVRNQNSAQQTASNFWIGGTGRADTALQAPLIDTATATALNIGTTNATLINLNKDVAVAAGKSLTLAGGTTASRPGTPTEGMMYYDTNTKQLLAYANGKWQADGKEAVIVAASNSSNADKASADYVADGSTAAPADGDQVQINDALTAAAGKKVVLLAGTYTADASILIPNNTTLAGVGLGTLVRLADIDSTDYLIENIDTTNGNVNIVIQDLRLDGQKSLNTVGTQHGIYFAKVYGGAVRNVWVDNFRSMGLALNYSNDNIIIGNTVSNNGGSGISSAYGNYNVFTGNKSQLNTGAGFSFSYQTGDNLSGNSIESNTGDGIAINYTTLTATGNTITGNSAYGVNAGGSSNNTIVGNDISNNGKGVHLSTSGNNNISGNTIKASGAGTTNDAIYLTSSDNNSIVGNTIWDNSATTNNYAINISDSTSNANYFANNRFSSTPGNSTIYNLGTDTVYSSQPLAENGAGVTNQAANSTAAFKIQNATGGSLFTVDSTNSRLYVGTVAGDTTGTVLVLGNKTDTGNPTGVDGAMYYNSDSKSFECYKNGLWGDCNFASLRSEWVLQEDFIDAGVATATIGTYEWTLTDTGSATEAKVNAATDASNRDRWGIYQTTTAATAGSGNMLRLDPNGMAGTPSNMTVEFDHGPSNAAAANGTQTVVRIGLMNGTTTSADPTDGIYFQYNTTTTAGNWFMCAQNNNAVTCADTGVARTTTLNTYQRFKFVTNSAGSSVEFFINEASVGTVSTNLPANTRPIGPVIAMHTVDAVARAWKIDYYQIKRNLTTLR